MSKKRTLNPVSEQPGERLIVGLFAGLLILFAWNTGTFGLGVREIVDGPGINYWQALGAVIIAQAFARVAGYAAARSYFRSTMLDSERYGRFLGETEATEEG